VLLHELTHGTSNRLHNNASGLSSAMARGMGEAWSDFYARALLSTAGEDPDAIYTTGGWITYLFPGYFDNYS
jgi:extracellular elastinolytic metalloproteinase